MSEEVKKLKKQTRELNKKLDSWLKKSRQTGKPVCVRCARLDNQNGRMKDYEHYTKDFELIKMNEGIKKQFNSKEEPVVFVCVDYTCPRGHGFSMHYKKSVYDEIFKKIKEEVKTKVEKKGKKE